VFKELIKLFIFIENIIDNTFVFISKIYLYTCNKDVLKKKIYQEQNSINNSMRVPKYIYSYTFH